MGCSREATWSLLTSTTCLCLLASITSKSAPHPASTCAGIALSRRACSPPMRTLSHTSAMWAVARLTSTATHRRLRLHPRRTSTTLWGALLCSWVHAWPSRSGFSCISRGSIAFVLSSCSIVTAAYGRRGRLQWFLSSWTSCGHGTVWSRPSAKLVWWVDAIVDFELPRGTGGEHTTHLVDRVLSRWLTFCRAARTLPVWRGLVWACVGLSDSCIGYEWTEEAIYIKSGGIDL